MDGDDAAHNVVSLSFSIKSDEPTLRSDPLRERARVHQNSLLPVNSKYGLEMAREGTHSSTREASRDLPYDESNPSRHGFRTLAEPAIDS